MRNLLFVKICLVGTLLLLRYTGTHSNEKPFVCQDLSCRYTSALKVHTSTQVHTDTQVHRYTQVFRYTNIFYKRCKQFETKENLFSYAYNKLKIKNLISLDIALLFLI